MVFFSLAVIFVLCVEVKKRCIKSFIDLFVAQFSCKNHKVVIITILYFIFLLFFSVAVIFLYLPYYFTSLSQVSVLKFNLLYFVPKSGLDCAISSFGLKV